MSDEQAVGERAEDRPSDRVNDEAALRARVSELEAELGASQESASEAGRRHAIDIELVRADAIDMESARAFVERAIERSGGDAAGAVAALRRDKPFLFKARARASGAVMAGRVGGHAARTEAAAEAARTGDRRALLEYLRSRRGA